jgi:hypothetical protein
MRDDEERDAEWIVAAPRLGGLVRVSAADDGSHTSECLVEEFLVHAAGLTLGVLAVAPRSAVDPVVQPLSSLAKTSTGAIVGSRDVPV